MEVMHQGLAFRIQQLTSKSSFGGTSGRSRKNACSARRDAACLPGIQAQASHEYLLSCSASCECLVCESLEKLSAGSGVASLAFDQKV